MSGILMAWRIEGRMTAVVEIISIAAEEQHHWQVFDGQGGCCPMSRGCLVGEGRATSVAAAIDEAKAAAQSALKVLAAMQDAAAKAERKTELFKLSDCADCQYHHKYFSDAFEKSGHCYMFREAPTNRCPQKVSMNAELRPPVFDPMWTGNGVS